MEVNGDASGGLTTINGASTEEHRQNGVNRRGIAIFGVGRIGLVHLKNLRADGRADILWLIDDEKTFPRLRQLLIECRLEDNTQLATPDSIQKVLGDPRVTAILNCTPVPHHEAIIRSALKAGKHVFTEKPIALSSDVAENLYKLAKAEKRILFCAFNRRHDPQLKRLQQSIKRGDIGDLRIIKICSRDSPSLCNPAYIKQSGGIFIDTMIHDFDMTCWLTNEIPESVLATGHAHDQTYADVGDVDTAAVVLKFKSGLIAMLENCRSAAYGYDQRVEVLGSKGMLVSSNPRSSQLEVWTPSGTQQDKIYFDFMDRYAESYVHEIKYFLDVLEGTVACEDEDGTGAITAVKLAEFCQKSIKTGQVVSL